MRLKLYWLYWLKNSNLTLQSMLATRLASLLFILGKVGRFGLFIGFLMALKSAVPDLFGYSFDQLIVFFLIFNLFDLIGQLFYRGIYWYRSEIISGNFDFTLTKPLNPLFQVLTAHTDWLDLPLLVIVLIMLGGYWPKTDPVTILSFAYFSFLSMIILTAVHIIVAAVGLLTSVVDHTMWIFRDLSQMARVPVDIYSAGVREFLTFVIPIGVIFTVPAKTLMHLLTAEWPILGLAIAFTFYLLSLKLWHFSLKRYASASS